MSPAVNTQSGTDQQHTTRSSSAMTSITPDAEGRRESARRSDGKFGTQESRENSEGTNALTAPELPPLTAGDVAAFSASGVRARFDKSTRTIAATLSDGRKLTVRPGKDEYGVAGYDIDVTSVGGEEEAEEEFAYSKVEAVAIADIYEREAQRRVVRRNIPDTPGVKRDRDGHTVKSKTYTLTDGTTRLGPDFDSDESHLVGFAHDGSPVMHYTAGEKGFYYGLSTCCWATDKGSEYGVVCRKCYHDFEGTANIFDERDIAVRVNRTEDV